MTLAELIRLVESKKRVMIIEAKDKAKFDYILADLVGRSVARLYSSSHKMPTLAEAYPSLFDSEEIQEQAQARRDELSALRFKQFAQTFNDKFGGANKRE